MSQTASPQPLVRVGHSPDPDDAFMFHAMANGKIDTCGLRIEQIHQDIETLNRRALAGELEVTAVSIHAYAHLVGSLSPDELRGQHGRRLRATHRGPRPAYPRGVARHAHRRAGEDDLGVPCPRALPGMASSPTRKWRSTRSWNRCATDSVRGRLAHPRRAADLR